jgi:hypothetical protein
MIKVERKGRNKYIATVSPVELSGEECSEMRSWCTEQFGRGGRNKQCRWRYGWVNSSDTYHFKHEADAIMFTLRWS